MNAAIESAGLTQVQLAKILDISQPAVSRRILGHVEWSVSELKVLATVLDVPVSTLVDDEQTAAAS